MYRFHTKLFTSYELESIGEWINSFYDPTKTNSQQEIKVISQKVLYKRLGSISNVENILVTIQVFKAN